MSSFKGNNLFGSGPHTFEEGRRGRRTVSYASVAGDPTLDGSFTAGDLERRVTVVGRLVATTASALWALRDAIATEAASTGTAGTLDDGHGRTWGGMKLLGFEVDGPTDRGRVFSVGYAAEFGVLTE